MKASDFFELPASLEVFAAHFEAGDPPWEWVRKIEQALNGWRFEEKALPKIPMGVRIEGKVYIHPTVRLPTYATIVGPVWIGPECEVRPGAFIRNQVIAGARSVLGHGSEYKNCLLLEDVETAHHNYVGDSVLGNRAHLGAGAICSNLRLDRKNVSVRGPESTFETGMRKLGAIVGDEAEVGCNAVLNPGALLGRRSVVVPAIAFGGYLPASTIAKGRMSSTKLIPRRD